MKLYKHVMSALLPLLLIAGCNETGITDADNLEAQLINPVPLGNYCEFVILAKSGISTVPNSFIDGDIGVSPIAQTAITGFALTDGDGFATSTQVSGFVYAADQEEPTPTNLTAAVLSMEAAYTNVANRPDPVETERNGGELGGEVFLAGVYKWTTNVTASTNFTISGDADDVWMFQIQGNLTVSSDVILTLSGGAKASNVFWQVAGEATIGTDAHFEGILLSKTAIHLLEGATYNGKLLAQTAVTLDQNSITDSGCSQPSDDGDDEDDVEIGDFGLLLPVNNCQSIFSCPDSVIFSWQAAMSDLPVTYYLHIDTLGGNFSNPLVTELSDDDGSKNTFSVGIGYITDFLIDQGIAKGVKKGYIWTVTAHVDGNVKKNAENVFILNMIRCD